MPGGSEDIRSPLSWAGRGRVPDELTGAGVTTIDPSSLRGRYDRGAPG
jgi:hypothetical protein